MKQMGVALSDDLRGKLNAARGDRSVAEEIRQRLERTVAEDELDPVTRELVGGLINLAARLSADFGAEWHASPRVHEEFAVAMAQRISGYQPPPKEGVGASDLLNEPAGTIGRMRERDDRRDHDYPLLKSAVSHHQRTRTAQAIKARRGE